MEVDANIGKRSFAVKVKRDLVLMDYQQAISTLEDEGEAKRASETSVTMPQMMSAAGWYSAERYLG